MRPKKFLFLQGPHGHFFFELSRALIAAGHEVLRIGINRGDQHYWPDPDTYIGFRDPITKWEHWLGRVLVLHQITDIVLYGDTRRIHQIAKRLGKSRGLTVHCFEEGYLRPYWITYERGGTNGNSRLMEFDLDQIRGLVSQSDAAQPDAPAQWGAMWHHTLLGSLYHANIVFRNRDYPHHKSHRAETVQQEWALHVKRLLRYPWQMLQRRVTTRMLMSKGLPYHVALLQLGHDASVQDHSTISSMREFIELVIRGFAQGAATHHQLVFKAHPLEDAREPIQEIISDLSRNHNVDNRVWFIHGGLLGPLLDRADSAITVNSTAAQQALWRGMPLKAFGRAVYSKPEFVSDQPLPAFFADPVPPDANAYRIFRQFLLETSQITGGYYTKEGRRAAKREVIDLMLSDCDAYDALARKKVTVGTKLEVVIGGNLTAASK